MLTLGHVPVLGSHCSGMSQWKLVPGPAQTETVNDSDQSMMPTFRVGVVRELEVDAALAPVHLQVWRVQHGRDEGGAGREHPRRAPHRHTGQVEKCG